MSLRWPSIVAGPGRYRLRLLAWGAFLLLLTFAVGQVESAIDADDQVIFFPTVGHVEEDGRNWALPIHGWVFEPEEDSRKRGLLLNLFRRGLGLGPEQAETALFLRRARAFLVDNEGGKLVTIRVGQREFPLEPSGANGHFFGTIRLSAEEVERQQHESVAKDNGLDFRAVLRPDDDRVFAGRVHLVSDAGISVVSDIDDTIKVTQVRNRKAMLRRTFLEKYEAVSDMAQTYIRWQRQGATIHYVSAGPWQLFSSLDEFLRAAGFPPGSFHMKVVRAKDRTLRDLFADADRTKRAAIEPLLTTLPRRRFVLVGDSGERDPEIYGDLARRYPEQVAAIFIRDVTGEDACALRYRDAFRGFSAERWRIFRDARELENVDFH